MASSMEIAMQQAAVASGRDQRIFEHRPAGKDSSQKVTAAAERHAIGSPNMDSCLLDRYSLIAVRRTSVSGFENGVGCTICFSALRSVVAGEGKRFCHS
jgi:hypothetical protein